MIVRLFCPQCAEEAAKKINKSIDIEVHVPVSQIADNGIYEVKCGKDHTSSVVLDNIKFELLFEMGLNALVDGYHREAVSSFSSSLERFYEFYWRAVMAHSGLDMSEIDKAWKPLSKMSERQVGAFTTAALIITKSKPKLLNPNKDVPFRNNVIHNGYVPNKGETIEYGNTILRLINQDLDELRKLGSDSVDSVYKAMSPNVVETDFGTDELVGFVNILTAIDVRHPPKDKDKRVGDVSNQIKRILYERQPMKMQLLTEQEIITKHPEYECLLSSKNG